MKSLGLYGKKFIALEVREREIKPPSFGEAVVKIQACGVCGTDLNFLKQWEGDPMALGHEIAAEIIEVGDGVPEMAPGDQVIVEDCSMCGTCINCKNGRSDLCINMFNIDGQPGMGRFMKVKHNSLVKFTGLSFTDACLTEPLAVSLNAVLQAEIPFDGSVVVLGSGPLGIMSALLAKARGAGFVAVTEIETKSKTGKARKGLAERSGLDMVLDAKEKDIEEEIRKVFPQGVDRVIVSAPPESIYDALKIIRYGGIITFFGLHFGQKNKILVDFNDLIFRKIMLRPVFAEPAMNFNIALDLLKEGIIPSQEIITHQFAFHEAEKVFSSMINGTEPVIKAVMVPEV